MQNTEQAEAADQVVQDQLAHRTNVESVTDCNKATAELARAKAAFWRSVGFAVVLLGIGAFAVLIAVTVHL
jgi:cell division protein FtsX